MAAQRCRALFMHLKRAAAPLVARLCGGTQAEILGHDNRETASTGSAGTETLAEPKQVEFVVDGIREEVEVLSEHSSDSYFTDTDTDADADTSTDVDTDTVTDIDKHTDTIRARTLTRTRRRRRTRTQAQTQHRQRHKHRYRQRF